MTRHSVFHRGLLNWAQDALVAPHRNTRTCTVTDPGLSICSLHRNLLSPLGNRWTYFPQPLQNLCRWHFCNKPISSSVISLQTLCVLSEVEKRSSSMKIIFKAIQHTKNSLSEMTPAVIKPSFQRVDELIHQSRSFAGWVVILHTKAENFPQARGLDIASNIFRFDAWPSPVCARKVAMEIACAAV